MNRTSTSELPHRQRSRVTNGHALFVDGDGNSAWSRRYRDLTVQHVIDMGGADRLSQAQIGLAKRCAAISVELELMGGRLSKGEPVDLDLFTRSASHLRRIYETLGLARVPKDINPKSFDQIATELAAE
jgi:hypothetical protein